MPGRQVCNGLHRKKLHAEKKLSCGCASARVRVRRKDESRNGRVAMEPL